MYIISRKSNLSRLIKKLTKFFPEEYNFYPKSWVCPVDMHELREFCASKKYPPLLICKPEASCQGRGIFLTKKLDEVPKEKIFVVQQYLKNPCLINQYKFDLRIYVLVTWCDPLKIFLYKDGLARFATEKYKPTTNSNKKKNNYMHLTNYAINKRNKNYNKGGDDGDSEDAHKRSITSVFKTLEREQGANIDLIWDGIKEIVIKTLLGVQPELSHIYKACQPSDKLGNMCFEILGFDVMLDKDLRPWLLEVNNSPSYNTDTSFDRLIKSDLIRNTFKLLNVSQMDRKTVKTMEKLEYDKRGHRPEAEQLKRDTERMEFYRKVYEQRTKHEQENLGMYELIYPLSYTSSTSAEDPPSHNEVRMKAYQGILSRARSIWIESTSGPTNRKPSKAKSIVKSPEKKEKLSKKALISPFKKIYEAGEAAKLKLKSKPRSTAENTIKKNLEFKAKESQRSGTVNTDRRKSIECEPKELMFKSPKKGIKMINFKPLFSKP